MSVVLIIAAAIIVGTVLATVSLSLSGESTAEPPDVELTPRYETDCGICRPDPPYVSVVEEPVDENDAKLTIFRGPGDKLVVDDLFVVDRTSNVTAPLVVPESGTAFKQGREIKAGEQIRIHLDQGDQVALMWQGEGVSDPVELLNYSAPGG